MLARINLLMQVLILSLSLSSSLLAAPDNYFIVGTKFNIISTDDRLTQDMLTSVSGIKDHQSYSKQDIDVLLKKAEDKLSVDISDWKLLKDGILVADVAKKTPIKKLIFEGNKTFSSRAISEQIGFRAQGSYCEDVCESLKQRVEKFYSEQGFLHAKFELKKTDNDKDGVDIVILIQEGEASLIDSLNIDVEGFESNDKISRVLDIRKGQRACSTCIQESIKRARTYLYNKGYYASSVYRDSVRFSADMKNVQVSIGVKTGPKYKIIFDGNNFFRSQRQLKDALDISDTIVVTPDYYPVLARKLEDHYKSFGFYEAVVTAVESLGLEAGQLFLTFRISEGKQRYIGRIKYDLKRSIGKHQIDEYLREKKAEFFEKGFFVKKEFEQMKELIERYLNERGYLRAKVLGLTFEKGKANYENITYQIDPGQSTLVREIKIEGNNFISTDKILSSMDIVKGEPINIDDLKNGIKWMTEYYKDNGYVDFYLDRDNLFSYSEDYRFVDVNILIKEGRQLKIGRIFIDGLVKTKERVISREFRFKKDDVITPKKIQDTENALAGLGFLGIVSVEVLPSSVYGQGYRDILVSVEEKKAGTYEIGAGYRTDEGLKLFSGISYGNLGGWGRRIYLDGSISRKLDDSFRFAEYDVLAGYYEPYFLNIPLDLRLAVEATKDDYPDYGQKKLDTALYFEKKIGDHSLILRNAFERINIFEATNPADDASYWKYSIRQSYRYDTRDSIFSPTRGFNFLVYGEWGHSLNTAVSTNYAKVEERMSFYVPLFSKFTLMSSLDTGYVKGLGGDDVLLNDRFSLGGFDSIRGYREGIIADLTPYLNHQQYYNFSIELRRLLFWNFVASVFHDMGAISSEDAQIHGTYCSVGGGIGIKFPVGSLSLQYGYVYKKDKRIPLDRAGRIHLAIGTF